MHVPSIVSYLTGREPQNTTVKIPSIASLQVDLPILMEKSSVDCDDLQEDIKNG
jgi:hypothetical protein